MPSTDQRIVEFLSSEGFTLENGWFYPSGDTSRAAVRIAVFEGQYQVWRRRKLSAPWMLIVTADVNEFSMDSFRLWHSTWPLTN
jgi:hypothetical protein